MKNSHPLKSGYKLAEQKFDKVKAWLTPPSKEYKTYVSYSHNNHKVKELPTPLSSTNHAFWIGKFPRKPDADENIYTKELLAGILDYMGANVPRGEKGVLYISRTLSELMNGHEDAKDCLSTEEQIALLYKLKNKYAPDLELEIVDLEKSHMHSALFQELRKHRLPAGVDTGWALGTGDISLDCEQEELSLRIARILYMASQKHPEFKAKLDKIVPKKLQSKIPEIPSIPYYGLVEIAIRLSELLQGKSTHGGAERQKVYDNLIHALISPKASSDSWNTVRESTKAIRDKFVGPKGEILHDFDGMYIDTSQNYFMKKSKWVKNKQKAALVAAGIAAGSIGVFGAGVGYEKHQQNQIQIRKNKTMEATVKKNNIYTGHYTETASSKAESVLYLQNSIDKVMDLLSKRVPIPGGLFDQTSFLKDLRSEIQDDLYDHSEDVPFLYISPYRRTLYMERFIARKPIFFLSYGIEVPPRHTQMPFSLKELRKIYCEKHTYENIEYERAIKEASLIAPPTYAMASETYTDPIYLFRGKTYGLSINYTSQKRTLSKWELEKSVVKMLRDIALSDMATIPSSVVEDLMDSASLKSNITELGFAHANKETFSSVIFDKSYVFHYQYVDGKRVLLTKREGDTIYSIKTTQEAYYVYQMLGLLVGNDGPWGMDDFGSPNREVVEFFRHSIKK